MEFYDLLEIIKIKDMDMWYVPVDDYFKNGDMLSISFQGEVIILRKRSSDNVSEFLARKCRLTEVKKDANSLWVLLPEWLVGLLSDRVEYFAVALSNDDFSGATPNAIALKPIKGRKVTLEAPKQKRQLEFLDINRGEKLADLSRPDVSATSLARDMLGSAFGDDPTFDPSLGVPKVIR